MGPRTAESPPASARRCGAWHRADRWNPDRAACRGWIGHPVDGGPALHAGVHRDLHAFEQGDARVVFRHRLAIGGAGKQRVPVRMNCAVESSETGSCAGVVELAGLGEPLIVGVRLGWLSPQLAAGAWIRVLLQPAPAAGCLRPARGCGGRQIAAIKIMSRAGDAKRGSRFIVCLLSVRVRYCSVFEQPFGRVFGIVLLSGRIRARQPCARRVVWLARVNFFRRIPRASPFTLFWPSACSCFLFFAAVAQDRAAGLQTAFARARHLQHGINASEWFAQSPATTPRRAQTDTRTRGT